MKKEYTIGWEQKCKGCGHHDSVWKSVMTSPEWKVWREHALKEMLYDIYECEELGIMSADHFRSFMDFCKKL